MALPTVQDAGGLYVIRNAVTGGEYYGSAQRLGRRWQLLVGSPGCFNIARDATAPMRGRRHTPEVIARQSARLKGKLHTPEHRAKIAAALRGKAKSPAHRAVIAANNRQRSLRPFSEETRRRLRLAHVGRPSRRQTAETCAKISATRRKLFAERRANGAADCR